jgi:predicted PurR-regulated permease PerM
MAAPAAKGPRYQERERDPRGLILWTLGVVVLTVVVGSVAVAARQAVLLIYVSALLAIGMSPAIQWVERQTLIPVGGPRLPRWLAILLVYLAVLATCAGIALLLLPPLLSQARSLAAILPELVQRAQEWLVQRGILHQPLSVGEIVQQAPVGADTLSSVAATLWGVVGGLLGVLTILILTFYLLLEADTLLRGLLWLVPREHRAHARTAAAQVRRKLSAWLSRQLALAAIIGASSALALGLLGVPYFFVLALLSALGECVPYLGPLLAALPALVMAGTVSWQLSVAVLLFFVVQQQVENYLLAPRIMEQQVGISPVGVIVALLVGGSLLGVVGALLAVPSAAILQVVLQELVFADDGDGEHGRADAGRRTAHDGTGANRRPMEAASRDLPPPVLHLGRPRRDGGGVVIEHVARIYRL